MASRKRKSKRSRRSALTGGSDVFIPPSKAAVMMKAANTQAVFTLLPGESIVVENGCLKMLDTILSLNVTTKDGFRSGFKRLFSGGNMFVNVLTNRSTKPGKLTACPQLPGDMIEIPMTPGDELMCSRSSVVAFTPNVSLESNIRLSGLLLSGVFFQRLRCQNGPGKAWVSAFGDISVTKLEPGQHVRLDHAYFVSCPASQPYKVRTLNGDDSTVSKLKNFLLTNNARLAMEFTGPGQIITQSRSLDPLIEHVASAAAEKVEDKSWF